MDNRKIAIFSISGVVIFVVFFASTLFALNLFHSGEKEALYIEAVEAYEKGDLEGALEKMLLLEEKGGDIGEIASEQAEGIREEIEQIEKEEELDELYQRALEEYEEENLEIALDKFLSLQDEGRDVSEYIENIEERMEELKREEIGEIVGSMMQEIDSFALDVSAGANHEGFQSSLSANVFVDNNTKGDLNLEVITEEGSGILEAEFVSLDDFYVKLSSFSSVAAEQFMFPPFVASQLEDSMWIRFPSSVEDIEEVDAYIETEELYELLITTLQEELYQEEIVGEEDGVIKYLVKIDEDVVFEVLDLLYQENLPGGVKELELLLHVSKESGYVERILLENHDLSFDISIFDLNKGFEIEAPDEYENIDELLEQVFM